MTYSAELGPIRPPSEAYSLLIRVTRNCPWNRCKFCPLYKGEKFELRSVEEVKQDIRAIKDIRDQVVELSSKSGYDDNLKRAAAAIYTNPPSDMARNVALWLYAGGENVFLQDANTLIMRTNELVEVIKLLKETLPSIKRITSYGRSKTAAKKTLEELIALRKAGLSRLHIGLESGYDPVLQYMDKGVTAVDHIKGGKKIVASGISLSEYVLLGMGGKQMWREHATETARVLNEIDPDFIRVRTLAINKRIPLYKEVEAGNFIRSTDEEIVEEEKLLIENLECHSNFVSDHIINLLQEIDGELPEDKEKMLAIIARFQALTPEEKTNFKLGRRAGIYINLDDLSDERKHEMVEQAIHKLSPEKNEVDEEVLYSLTQNYI